MPGAGSSGAGGVGCLVRGPNRPCRAARRCGLGVLSAAFLAGLLSDWATYATTAFELSVALHGARSLLAVFGGLCLAFAPTQLPLGLIEGAVTAGALSFLQRRRRRIFERIAGVSLELP